MEKEKSEFKPVKLCLKIDLVSYPARTEGLVNIYMPRPMLGIEFEPSDGLSDNLFVHHAASHGSRDFGGG